MGLGHDRVVDSSADEC
jgi:hypothetical protein